MLQFFRRIRLSGAKARARRVAPVARLQLEHLEERELLTAPIPPTGVVATGISASAITVNWNASTDPSVTGYDVYEKTWSGGRVGHWVYTEVGSNLTTPKETLTGLKSGSTHSIRSRVEGDDSIAGLKPGPRLVSAVQWLADDAIPPNVTAGLLTAG